jgi:SAM-dependent methyltransferase
MTDAFSQQPVAGGAPKHDGWDSYWATDVHGSHRAYAVLASIYRRVFICTRLAWWLKKTFPRGARLLHAGCGSGEVDSLVREHFRITGLDISPGALKRYRSNNPDAEQTIHADLMNLRDVPGNYDGVYSLGVLEHFTPDEIRLILDNMRLVLRPGGKMVAFWPLASAPSVKALGLWHRLLNKRGERAIELHPPEITLIRSRSQVEEIICSAGWQLTSYSVSPSDLFIQAVLVCE